MTQPPSAGRMQRWLAAAAGASGRHAGLALLLAALLAAAALALAATRLGMSTDTDALFAASLPWRQRQIAWDRAFPQFNDLMVAVVDGATPEQVEATAAALQRALAADRAHFTDAWRPDASPYLARNGLMFLDPKDLAVLLDGLVDAQPFLGQLAADPSLRGLFGALGLVALGVEQGQANLTPFAPALRGFHTALAAAAAGHPAPLSWQSLLAGPLASLAGPYRFVLAHPVLDYSGLQPGEAATAALREAAARLEFVADGSAHVRLTGSVALADEEFATVAQGMAAGTAASVALIALWLWLAVRSWRLIVPILGTLLLGLSLTLGFATLAVGTLNLISIAFAILFVGIAVDFAIQFAVRFRQALSVEPAPLDALALTGRHAGPEILVAAAASACGFLAFLPTDFAGVAELGLIAGGGMVIAFVCTVLVLPAALRVLKPRPEPAAVGFAWGGRAEAWLVRRRHLVLALFAAASVAGAALLPSLRFDSDPLHTKDASTEAMRTLADLAASPLTDPYSADLLAPDLAHADALAGRLRKLPLVAQVMTLSSFVPQQQAETLPLIQDAAALLAATLAPLPPAAPLDASGLRAAARKTLAALRRATATLPASDPLAAITGDLAALADAPDAVLLAANTALTRFLPAQLDTLRQALQAGPVTAPDVPPALARDWLLPDGRARVQAIGTPAAHGAEGLHALVAQLRSVAPDIGGTAVTIVETAATVTGAFRMAAITALAAIAALLAVALRRWLDMLLVLLPLLIAALLTTAAAAAAGLSLNFANIIALPLLLGVGVSFNVYFVMGWRAGAERFLGSATARAISFSALTTATAFGSLAVSGHPGTASMGVLLLLSLGATVTTTLVCLPVLLRHPLLLRWRGAPATGPHAPAG